MSRYDLDRDGLAALVSDEPSYRLDQLFEGLYDQLSEPSELTALPRSLREKLGACEELRAALEVARTQVADQGRTVKWLFRLADGAVVETVLMAYPRHTTVCISSQAGCAMGCTFCATGDGGFTRQLTVGEILEQVVRAARAARGAGRRLDHVVYMGMGEPLANYERVATSLRRLTANLGLSARHLTVSTVGIVPGIRRLATLELPVNLAISLHAGRDELRDELVPINRRYPLESVIVAGEEFLTRTRRRLSLEWALIDTVNDTARDAAELAAVALRLRAHVNLIPLNPTSGGLARGMRGTPRAAVAAFRDRLASAGVNVTIRQTRGRAIDAACGQLAGASAYDSAAPARA